MSRLALQGKPEAQKRSTGNDHRLSVDKRMQQAAIELAMVSQV
jgi:hypothetical protein